MNILHITTDYQPNPLWGMGHSVFNAFKSFNKFYKKDNIYILSSNKSSSFHKNIITTAKITDDNLLSKNKYEIIDNYDDFIKWNYELFNVADTYIRENGITFDVIHCHNWMSWITAFELKKKHGIKVVSTLHFLQRQYDEMEENPIKDKDLEIINLEIEMLHSSDAIICLNESQVNFLRDKYDYVSDKIFIIPHFVTEKFARKINASKNVLFVGRVEKDKGINLLIDVFNKLAQHHDNIKLYVIGDGSLLKELKSKKYPNIIFTGFLQKDKLLTFYKKCSIFCLPSKSESFGMSVTEAMSQGLCPIFSRGKYLPVLFKDNESGIAVDINDRSVTEKLYAKIENLLNDEDKLRQIRFKAIKYSKENFSEAVIVHKTRDTYKKILSKK